MLWKRVGSVASPWRALGCRQRSSKAGASSLSSVRGMRRWSVEQLDANVVGGGLEVGNHSPSYGVDVAPCHDGVDQLVGSTASEVGLRPAEPEQIVAVVVEAKVVLHMVAGYQPRLVGIGRENRRLLGSDERPIPHLGSGGGGVLDGNKVRMGAPSPLGGETKHFGAGAARTSPIIHGFLVVEGLGSAKTPS